MFLNDVSSYSIIKVLERPSKVQTCFLPMYQMCASISAQENIFRQKKKKKKKKKATEI